MHTFFLAMTLHPEVQRRCQDEIDSVTGKSRLPDIADRDALPYTNATMWELMRWQPVSPIGTSLPITLVFFLLIFDAYRRRSALFNI